MASSMTIPTASVRPSSESTLRVMPSARATANVPTMDVGMAIAAIRVARTLRRKRSTTTAARTAPIERCSATAWTEARTSSLLSWRTRTSSPSGRERFAPSSRACTSSATVTVLAPGFRMTATISPGLPESVARESAGRPASSTLPMSFT